MSDICCRLSAGTARTSLYVQRTSCTGSHCASLPLFLEGANARHNNIFADFSFCVSSDSFLGCSRLAPCACECHVRERVFLDFSWAADGIWLLQQEAPHGPPPQLLAAADGSPVASPRRDLGQIFFTPGAPRGSTNKGWDWRSRSMNIAYVLRFASPFFPGILSRKPPKSLKNSWFLKRMMAEKNGQGLNP